MLPWHNFPPMDQRLLNILYTEPHRQYHDIDHPGHVYDYCIYLAEKSGIYGRARSIPVWYFQRVSSYHDAYYQIGDTSNETKSAQIWRDSEAASTLVADEVDHVSATIVSSANHWMASNEALPIEAKIFLDADILELSAPYGVFAHNARRVIEEYTSKYTREEVLRGRIAWYQKVLTYDRIYWTVPERDDRARANIKQGIVDLQEELNNGKTI